MEFTEEQLFLDSVALYSLIEDIGENIYNNHILIHPEHKNHSIFTFEWDNDLYENENRTVLQHLSEDIIFNIHSNLNDTIYHMRKLFSIAWSYFERLLEIENIGEIVKEQSFIKNNIIIIQTIFDELSNTEDYYHQNIWRLRTNQL